jgi:hypothetical protein
MATAVFPIDAQTQMTKPSPINEDSQWLQSLEYVRKYRANTLALSAPQKKLLAVMFRGRETQMDNNNTLGEALWSILNCDDIEEEIRVWWTPKEKYYGR